MKWKLTNPKHSREWATIQFNPNTDQYQNIYNSKYGGTYTNYTSTLKGAKSSMTRYLGYKTEWKEL
jgi:hypothetical protein